MHENILFCKILFLFLIQTPGIRMAVLSVYQWSINISNKLINKHNEYIFTIRRKIHLI
jgi:hypothetical protein